MRVSTGSAVVAIAAIDTLTHVDAASIAASIHMHYEGEVVETPLSSFSGVDEVDGVAVLAPGQGLVELFPADAQSLRDLAPIAIEASASGWIVGVVLPSGRMGEGHGALRGFPAHLQPWWPDAGRICFGGPEVA